MAGSVTAMRISPIRMGWVVGDKETHTDKSGWIGFKNCRTHFINPKNKVFLHHQMFLAGSDIS